MRYDPGASFSSHDHPGGEEILVLEGTFSDQTGDYGAGTYFRNPPGFIHAPFSSEGCLILVKLHQFAANDNRHVTMDTLGGDWHTGNAGQQVLQLHNHDSEQVRMARTRQDSATLSTNDEGSEVFVIAGAVEDEDGIYNAGTWIRNPVGFEQPLALSRESLVWLKTGHLNL